MLGSDLSPTQGTEFVSWISQMPALGTAEHLPAQLKLRAAVRAKEFDCRYYLSALFVDADFHF